jgi:hypothetical protein
MHGNWPSKRSQLLNCKDLNHCVSQSKWFCPNKFLDCSGVRVQSYPLTKLFDDDDDERFTYKGIYH